MRISELFIGVAALGVFESVYHAWLEKAFVTNTFAVTYSSYASFFGVPYWVFGFLWFPPVLALGYWSTRGGDRPLRLSFLVLLTVGNLFTVYLWYLDLDVVMAYTVTYVALYVTNYVLTFLVVLQNWSSDVVHGFASGTIVGAVLGGALVVLFGPFALAPFVTAGGILGALRNYALSKE